MSTLMTRSVLLLGCLVVQSFGQGLNLDSLYLSSPTRGEANAMTEAFHIIKKDGSESFQKWSLYEPDAFNPYSTNPSIYPLINCLRAIRAQRFSVPLPIANGDIYAWLSNHFKNGHIELSLDNDFNYAGSNYIHIHSVFWDVRYGTDPFKPEIPFWHDPWIYKAQLIVHETRHLDANAPYHSADGDDASLAGEGAFGWACIYQMWVWKYGLNFSPRQRLAAGVQARFFLISRFETMPPTHPNPAIQSIINELSITTPNPVKAEAGKDTVIMIPATASRGVLRLNGGNSFSLSASIARYIWHSPSPYHYFITNRPDTLLSLSPETYTWILRVIDNKNNISDRDTMIVKIINSATAVHMEPQKPVRSDLIANYPNPFNPSTEICYALSTPGPVVVEIFDLVGHHIRTLVDQWQDAGEHRVRFTSNGLASGVYLCRLQTKDAIAVRRMLLMR